MIALTYFFKKVGQNTKNLSLEAPKYQVFLSGKSNKGPDKAVSSQGLDAECIHGIQTKKGESAVL